VKIWCSKMELNLIILKICKISFIAQLFFWYEYFGLMRSLVPLLEHILVSYECHYEFAYQLKYFKNRLFYFNLIKIICMYGCQCN
jgi:hypothetical protein